MQYGLCEKSIRTAKMVLVVAAVVPVVSERNIAANKIPHIADVFRFGGHRLFRIFAHSAGLHYNRICFLIGLHILPIGAV